ncbi:MAG: ankyrin repeat domain-containing protein, partial [Microbacteriaceae bacterium]|nr:ankyrin repeat domain-containing protein [Microbacteriaceae bacterium]
MHERTNPDAPGFEHSGADRREYERQAATAPPSVEPSAAAIELANRLFDFARTGAEAELAAYLDAGAPLMMRNAAGDTFLTLAAYHQQPGTVRMLLERGADLEAANDRGQRALTCAVFKQDAESTRLLLDAGADPDAGEPTARATAQMFGWAEFAQLLAEREPR